MREGRELNYKIFLFSDLYYYIFCYDKDILHNSIKKHSWILPFAKVFPRENDFFFLFAKVFSVKFVPKTVIRESFCQTIRVFFVTQKFLPLSLVSTKILIALIPLKQVDFNRVKFSTPVFLPPDLQILTRINSFKILKVEIKIFSFQN